jgi:hypothetical protein
VEQSSRDGAPLSSPKNPVIPRSNLQSSRYNTMHTGKRNTRTNSYLESHDAAPQPSATRNAKASRAARSVTAAEEECLAGHILLLRPSPVPHDSDRAPTDDKNEDWSRWIFFFTLGKPSGDHGYPSPLTLAAVCYALLG